MTLIPLFWFRSETRLSDQNAWASALTAAHPKFVLMRERYYAMMDWLVDQPSPFQFRVSHYAYNLRPRYVVVKIEIEIEDELAAVDCRLRFPMEDEGLYESQTGAFIHA